MKVPILEGVIRGELEIKHIPAFYDQLVKPYREENGLTDEQMTMDYLVIRQRKTTRLCPSNSQLSAEEGRNTKIAKQNAANERSRLSAEIEKVQSKRRKRPLKHEERQN
jgi:hypothetical protein